MRTRFNIQSVCRAIVPALVLPVLWHAVPAYGQGGELEPSGPPGQTMVSLQELKDAIDTVGEGTSAIVETVSTGENFCVMGSGSVAVWNHANSEWDEVTVRFPTKVVESNGNFCVIGSNEAKAWTPASGWVSLEESVSGIIDVLGSNGNFCLWASGNSIAAFDGNGEVPGWKVERGDRYDQVFASNGNFCGVGPNRATAWNKVTGEWRRLTITGASTAASADANRR
jgi:hypothetical protein